MLDDYAQPIHGGEIEWEILWIESQGRGSRCEEAHSREREALGEHTLPSMAAPN